MSFVLHQSFVQDVSCEGVDGGIVDSQLKGVNLLGGELVLFRHGVSIMGVYSSMLSNN